LPVSCEFPTKNSKKDTKNINLKPKKYEDQKTLNCKRGKKNLKPLTAIQTQKILRLLEMSDPFKKDFLKMPIRVKE
jgi:hypothetical protein